MDYKERLEHERKAFELGPTARNRIDAHLADCASFWKGTQVAESRRLGKLVHWDGSQSRM